MNDTNMTAIAIGLLLLLLMCCSFSSGLHFMMQTPIPSSEDDGDGDGGDSDGGDSGDSGDSGDGSGSGITQQNIDDIVSDVTNSLLPGITSLGTQMTSIEDVVGEDSSIRKVSYLPYNIDTTTASPHEALMAITDDNLGLGCNTNEILRDITHSTSDSRFETTCVTPENIFPHDGLNYKKYVVPLTYSDLTSVFPYCNDDADFRRGLSSFKYTTTSDGSGLLLYDCIQLPNSHISDNNIIVTEDIETDASGKPLHTIFKGCADDQFIKGFGIVRDDTNKTLMLKTTCVKKNPEESTEGA